MPLRLPITTDTIHTVITDTASIEACLPQLTPETLASLYLLTKLDTAAALTLHTAESILSNIIDFYHLNATNDAEKKQFSIELARKIDKTSITTVLNTLESHHISLMHAEELKHKHYLTAQNTWNWEYKHIYSTYFFKNHTQKTQHTHASKEENRLLNIILSDTNESIDIQGYAGTGKTWLITQLANELPKKNVVFLAETASQAYAIKQRIPDIKTYTFGQICKLLNPNQTNINQNTRLSQIDFSKLSKKINPNAYPAQLNEKLLFSAWKTLDRYCYSDDAEINIQHIVGIGLQDKEKYQATIILCANIMWRILHKKHNEIQLPLRDYHIIKYYALSGLGLPFQYIIIDETHNLSKPILQIINNSENSIFSFGDYYQDLSGRDKPYQSNHSLRKNNLSQSIRLGANMDNFLNDLLIQHPITPIAPIEGNYTKTTKIIKYDKFYIPEKYCAVLADSIWSIFYIVYTMARQQQKYNILPATKEIMNRVIGEAINLFNGRHFIPQPEFKNNFNWERFIDGNKHADKALKAVDTIFKSGFDSDNLKNLIQGSHVNASNLNEHHVVSLVKETRNHEFERVMLINDVISDALFLNTYTGKTQTQIINHIYTGVSRATTEVYIPEAMLEWLN